jgi:hypothetical protein
MTFFSSKRRVVAAAVAVLLLFLVRPGAGRLKSRIAASISAGVGRPVEISSVHLRLLPRPGFDLENLVVDEDPAFGSEPLLRSADVTAVVRLTSLLRGRLEIARLNLTEPSLNLVRGTNGRWNVEVLLERAARTSLAPTAKARSGPRPAFPYIEGTSGRINFKLGQEKKPYALTNADFSLWQDSENAWGVRLEAQPFRSDRNLSDMGLLRVNGAWERAASLRETPLQFAVEWIRPQLGQLTRFFTGSDQGWRGALRVDATLAGTPAQLRISSDATVRDFRRYDIVDGEPLRLAVHCDGRYSSIDRTVHELDCRSPVGNGLIRLSGELAWPGSRHYDLMVTAEKLPVSAVLALVQHARKNLPQDMTAAGTVEASLSVQEKETAPGGLRLAGSGEIAHLRLASASSKAELNPATISFALASGNSATEIGLGKTGLTDSSRIGRGRDSDISKTKSGSLAKRSFPEIRFPDAPHLEFNPFALVMGKGAPVMARAWVSGSGYGVALAGEAEIQRVLGAARLFGLPAPPTTADGDAQIDLQIAGSWTEQAPGVGAEAPHAQVVGTAKLRNVRAELRGVQRPIEIASAELQLTPTAVRVTRLSANAAHALWAGSLELPRGCGAPAACLVQFDLGTSETSMGALEEWVNPRPQQRPWYRLLTPAAQAMPNFLAKLRAAGHLTIGRLQIHTLAAAHVSARAELDEGRLRLSDLRADFLGGRHRGECQADFSVKPPVYSGSGILSDVSLRLVGDAMKDSWITGSASAKYQLTASGLSLGEFWRSAEGLVQFDMRDGSLTHLSLANEAGPVQIEQFLGQARLHEGKIEIKEARLNSTAGAYQVSGTASLSRELDIELTRGPTANHAGAGRGYTISGTLAAPRVVANPETQAKLKP